MSETPSPFPLTDREAEELHRIGWSSGFGWQRDFDWFHNPSYGPAIFLEDDAKYMARWLDDLHSIRAEHARERQREAGPELYEALKLIEWGAEDHHQEPTCPACMRSRTIGHHDGCSVDAALATAEGRS